MYFKVSGRHNPHTNNWIKENSAVCEVTGYFEGRKQGSKLAKFGRSKEKRSDARLVVAALVIVMCIYDALKYKYAPFIRKKSVVPKPQTLKNEVVENYKFMNG